MSVPGGSEKKLESNLAKRFEEKTCPVLTHYIFLLEHYTHP